MSRPVWPSPRPNVMPSVTCLPGTGTGSAGAPPAAPPTPEPPRVLAACCCCSCCAFPAPPCPSAEPLRPAAVAAAAAADIPGLPGSTLPAAPPLLDESCEESSLSETPRGIDPPCAGACARAASAAAWRPSPPARAGYDPMGGISARIPPSFLRRHGGDSGGVSALGSPCMKSVVPACDNSARRGGRSTMSNARDNASRGKRLARPGTFTRVAPHTGGTQPVPDSEESA